jgi:hypothetical protein
MCAVLSTCCVEELGEMKSGMCHLRRTTRKYIDCNLRRRQRSCSEAVTLLGNHCGGTNS